MGYSTSYKTSAQIKDLLKRKPLFPGVLNDKGWTITEWSQNLVDAPGILGRDFWRFPQSTLKTLLKDPDNGFNVNDEKTMIIWQATHFNIYIKWEYKE